MKAQQFVELLMTINCCNRLNIATGVTPPPRPAVQDVAHQ